MKTIQPKKWIILGTKIRITRIRIKTISEQIKYNQEITTTPVRIILDKIKINQEITRITQITLIQVQIILDRIKISRILSRIQIRINRIITTRITSRINQFFSTIIREIKYNFNKTWRVILMEISLEQKVIILLM